MPDHKGQRQDTQKQGFMITQKDDQKRHNSTERNRYQPKSIIKNKIPPKRSSHTLNKTLKTPVNTIALTCGNRHNLRKYHKDNRNHSYPPEQHFFEPILAIFRRNP